MAENNKPKYECVSACFFIGISAVAPLCANRGIIKPCISQGFFMIKFLRRLFCFHQFDYESDIFVQVECRKCGKKLK